MPRIMLEAAIASYRRMFAGAAAVVAVMGVVSFVSALEMGIDKPASLTILGFRIVGSVALLVLLRWGYVRLKDELGKAAEEHRRILDLAYQDALTGAFTRSYFLSELKEQLQGDRPVAYLQIDMDNLKVLNDSHGHGAGDTALVNLVRSIRRLLPDATIGRLGGDEFGLFVTGQDSKPALVRLGDRILSALGEPTHIDGREIRLSATIGIAVWPQDAAEVSELVSKADLALYKGKKLGRANTVAFEADFLADERHKRFVERDLRAAILLNELELHYQPIHAADGSGVLCSEALVRWLHPVRGRILPGDFIAVAEQSDLIDKLGDWVLRRACRDLASIPGGSVSINVSVVQLRRPDFTERFTAILDSTGVDPHRLVIEVTESIPLNSGVIELGNITALRSLGVRVAIDDFGAGFASLEYLRRFPFDIIKIDRSYVSNLPGSRIDGLIVSAIVKIARSLKVEVVAEGIETEHQRSFLERAGVTGMQGYLLGRPAPLRAQLELVKAA
ncbi:MAG: putative bifunctional diguanylate cyclase/phosphodiesterase [Devosia sp.]